MNLRNMAATVLALAVMGTVASAGTIPFYVYNDEDGADLTPVSKLELEVRENSAGTGGFFIVTNDNPITGDGSATKVGAFYFESGLSTYIENLVFDTVNTDTTEVDLTTPSAPPLPAPTLVPAWTGNVFSASHQHGDALDAGEEAWFSFDYKGSSGLSDVLGVLPHDGTNTGRVILHVQGLPDNDYSVWAVTTIPLPAGAWMGLALLGGLGLAQVVRRRRRLNAI